MNRRDLLTSAPFAIATLTNPADAKAITPVMHQLKVWRQLWDRSHDPRLSDAQHGQVIDDLCAVESVIMALPCQTAEDWIAKIVSSTCFGDFCPASRVEDPRLWDEADRFVGGRT